MKEHIKKRIALGIFVFSISVLFILIFVAFQKPKQITGQVGQDVEDIGDTEAVISEVVSCEDSDKGKDYSNRGTVYYCDSNGCYSEGDSCSDKKLIEWYCENNEKKFEVYECEYDCDRGTCVELVEDYKYSYTGGGGGGSGGGSTSSISTTIETGQTYNLGELSLEQHLEVFKNDIITFSISNNPYALSLTDNTETQITLISGQTFILVVGNDNNLDLNSDSVSDIYVKVKSINLVTKKINLILRLA